MAEAILPPEDTSPSEPAEVYALAETVSPPEPLMTVSADVISEAQAEPVAEVMPEPVVAAPVSTLGESLIASGIVARAASPRSDPLAPVRRMSQAEKIAFFS